MAQNNLLVVGTVAMDDVETPFGCVKNALGGSASFFSAAARFFCPVSIVGVVGKDFPPKYLALLRKLGIDTVGIHTDEGKTFHWSGYYGFDLNSAKTRKTELNVLEHFRPVLSAAHRKSPYVFLANIDPDIQRAVLFEVKKPRISACDTMNFWIEHKRKSLMALLKRVDIFFCNDSEARLLTGEYHLAKAARFLLRQGPKLIVLKKGEHGVLCFTDDDVFVSPAFLVEKVFDPTGAGDSFAGAFMGSLVGSGRLNAAAVRRAAIYGSVVASFNVESFSLNRLASLSKREIDQRVREFKRMTAF